MVISWSRFSDLAFLSMVTKVVSSLGSTSQCRSRPTVLSFGLDEISLRAEMRVRAPSFRMNSVRCDRLFTARISSNRKSEKKYPECLKDTNIDSKSWAPPTRYLKTSLPCCSMMVLAHRREERNGKLAGMRGTGLCDTLGSTSLTTWKFENERDSSWGHEVAIAVRSGVRIMASVELSISSREIFLPHAARKSVKPVREVCWGG